ncbi:MAG TPA: hypothetical protein VG603_01560 [Chitinophagales bacterium]|nr:hypothetical protein [Chitinophagales bacterium]
MKKLYLLAPLILVASITYSQISFRQAADTMLLNFAIPDQPAFNALGTNPSNIIRPSNTRDLALAFSPFYTNGKVIIPPAFALDFSPGMMYLTKKPVNNYEKLYALYNTSISVGTNIDSAKKLNSIAVGLNMNVYNEGDQLKDKDYKNAVHAMLRERNDLRNTVMEQLLAQHAHDATPWADEDFEKGGKHYTDLQNAFTSQLALVDAHMGDRLDSLNKDFKAKHWNSRRVDVALAFVAGNTDSVIDKKMFFSKEMFWVTYSQPFTKYGQWLIGLNQQTARNYSNENFVINASLSSRVYVGNNRIKGFVELQGTYSNDSTLASHWSDLFNSGLEFTIKDFIWVSLDAGAKNWGVKGIKAEPYFTWDWKFTLPENFSLFK